MARKKAKNPPHRGARHDRLRTRVHDDKRKKPRREPWIEEDDEVASSERKRSRR